MRQIRTSHHALSKRATPLWLMMAGGFVLVGIFLFALTLAGLMGMLRLFSAPVQPSVAAPVLLVAPDLSALTVAPVAATPASAALQQIVASPLPTSTATPAAPVTQPLTQPLTQPSPAQVLTAPTPTQVVSPASPTLTYRALFQEIGDAYGIDWRLLAALAFRESRMDPVAVGRDGDMGLMQILPTTWDEFAPRAQAVEPFDARHNVEVAATYLLYLQDKLNEVGYGEIYWVLVAYNWGPNNVRRLLNNGGEWNDVPARQRQYAEEILEAAFGVRFVE